MAVLDTKFVKKLNDKIIPSISHSDMIRLHFTYSQWLDNIKNSKRTQLI